MSEKGGIGHDPRMRRWYVSWYHGGKTHKIWFYNGIPLDSERLADRLRTAMRSDEDRGVFRIERYLHQKSEIGPLIDDWIKNVIAKRAPATKSLYKSLLDKHVKPFFDEKRLCLNEIDYGILLELKNRLEIAESSQKVLFRILKSFLLYAKKLNRIESLPVLPSGDDFTIEEKPPVWLSEERQMRVINAIEPEHHPIFLWLKYHFRRPGEACALQKQDWDGERFIIRRTFSNQELHNRPKHKKITTIRCVAPYWPILKAYQRQEYQLASPFFFVNPNGRAKGKHYNLSTLRDIVERACKKTGENIGLYQLTKHSSASQLVNEYGLNPHDVQMVLDCSPNTVRHYAQAEESARSAILDKVFKPDKRKSGT